MARPRKRSKDEPRAVALERAGLASGAEAPDVAAEGTAELDSATRGEPRAVAPPRTQTLAHPAGSADRSGVLGARRVVVAVAVASVGLGVTLGMGPLAPVRVSAWAALACLLCALACSPLAELATRIGSPRARLAGELAVRARRGIGVTAYGLALTHAALALLVHLGPDVGGVLAIDRLRHGALALLLLTPLALTSSRRVTAALRLRGWKALHRAAYPAAILAVAHAVRAPFAPPRALLVAGAFLAVLLLTRPVLALVRRRSRGAMPGRPVTER